jgi:hypothetical protein
VLQRDCEFFNCGRVSRTPTLPRFSSIQRQEVHVKRLCGSFVVGSLCLLVLPVEGRAATITDITIYPTEHPGVVPVDTPAGVGVDIFGPSTGDGILARFTYQVTADADEPPFWAASLSAVPAMMPGASVDMWTIFCLNGTWVSGLPFSLTPTCSTNTTMNGPALSWRAFMVGPTTLALGGTTSTAIEIPHMLTFGVLTFINIGLVGPEHDIYLANLHQAGIPGHPEGPGLIKAEARFTQVPEPGMLSLFGLGVAWWLRHRRRPTP